MYNQQAISEAMMRIVAPRGVALTDPAKVTENMHSALGEYGVNPDDAYAVGTFICMAASQAGESPEDTVVQSFVVGMLVGFHLAGQSAT